MKSFAKIIFVCIFLFNAVSFSFGSNFSDQPIRFTVSGFVKDRQTTEDMIGATVHSALSKSGTSTNRYGFYSITLSGGNVRLIFSFVGYEPETVEFNLNRDTVINISMNSAMYIEEVVIEGYKTEPVQERTQMSVINLPISQIKSMPALFGETDVLRTLQMTPGIQTGNEGQGGLFVRGGAPDQNLFLLDGVPLYNVSHLFGFFSTFNADAVNHVEVLKGGFPARYGERVSSVVDITLKEGNLHEFHGEGAIGIISSKITLEGPVIKDKTSFIVSGRRTYADLFIRPFQDKYRTGYYFYDLTAKMNHKFSDNDRIYMSAYSGDDVFFQDEKNETTETFSEEKEVYTRRKYISDTRQGTFVTAFRWNHIFNRQLFSNTTLSYSRYRNSMEKESTTFIRMTEGTMNTENNTRYAMANHSEIRDLSVKIMFDFLPSPAHHIRFGAQAANHYFSTGITATRVDSAVLNIQASNYRHWEFGAYVEDDIRISQWLGMNIGVRWSSYAAGETVYQSVQPRVSLRYLLNDDLSLKASYSNTAQYIHLLTNSGIGLQTDLWVPSTGIMKPQYSDQYTIGLAQNLKNEYEVTLEGYYKTMKNVIEFREGSTFFDNSEIWEEKSVQGKGCSYGVEFFTQKKTGSLTGWIGYALSWSNRLFDELNNGKRFPYKYDRRHDLNIVLMKKFGKNIELSGSWVFSSGACANLPVSVYYMVSSMENGIPGLYGLDNFAVEKSFTDYGDRNSYRMGAYHRLDLSVSLIKNKKWGERRWIFGAYNAYCRKNPFYIDVREKIRFQEYEFIQYSLFPIIPSVSYQFKF